MAEKVWKMLADAAASANCIGERFGQAFKNVGNFCRTILARGFAHSQNIARPFESLAESAQAPPSSPLTKYAPCGTLLLHRAVWYEVGTILANENRQMVRTTA
jgi:hypothetical protein